MGAYVVQLAKRSGYFVAGVAGSSADYAKSSGADVVVDYRGKSLEQQLRLGIPTSWWARPRLHLLGRKCCGKRATSHGLGNEVRAAETQTHSRAWIA